MIDYIEFIVWAQILVIGLLITKQSIFDLKKLNIFYFLTLILHAVFFALIPDEAAVNQPLWFYVIGGALDFSVIIYTCRMRDVFRVASAIQDVSLASIMFNTLGFALSFADKLPEVYMSLFVLLYGWAIFNLYRGEPKDGSIKVDTRLFAFGRHVHKWHLCGNVKQEKK